MIALLYIFLFPALGKIRSYSKDLTLDIVSLHEAAYLRTSVQMYGKYCFT